ncbi:MAG: phosphatidate cytidylyltransferase, partial [Actinomycetota bacterium]
HDGDENARVVSASRRPGAAGSADKPRSVGMAVATGLVLAVLVVGTLVTGRIAFFALAFVVVIIAQAELYAVLKAAGFSPVVLVGLICGGVILAGAYYRGTPALALGLVLPIPVLLLWGLTVPADRVRSILSSTYFGIVYGPLLVAFAVLLLRGPDGLVLTATIVGMSAMHDAGAYLIGRKIGRHKLAPRTSPGKTWEGWAAGTVVMVGLSAAVLPLIHPFDVWLAVRLALVMSVTTPLGDLVESLVKRDLGVKDMGSLVPGHGGFFDRIDAIIFNAPVAYYVLRTLEWAG